MKKMEVKSIGIVGTGVIGASWAAFYLSRGFDVRAADPADGAEGRLRDLVASYWPTLEQLGLTKGASQDRLTFGTDISKILSGVDFVQENGPERLDIKRDLIANIDGPYPTMRLLRRVRTEFLSARFKTQRSTRSGLFWVIHSVRLTSYLSLRC